MPNITNITKPSPGQITGIADVSKVTANKVQGAVGQIKDR